MLNFMKMDNFTIAVISTKLLGVLILLLVFSWLISYRGGFAWQSFPNKQFNWHPLLLIAGMIVLYGSAILVYRTLKNTKKSTAKVIHGGLNLLGMVFTSVGLKAVFDSHDLSTPPIRHMYSLHSWFGVLAASLVVVQWLCGFFIFFWPVDNAATKASYYPLHTFVGILGLALATLAALLGFTEKAIYSVPGYSSFQTEGLFVNILGVLVLCYAFSVVYLVINPEYKRPPEGESQGLLMAKA